jgi:hypothetical protein
VIRRFHYTALGIGSENAPIAADGEPNTFEFAGLIFAEPHSLSGIGVPGHAPSHDAELWAWFP